MTHLIDKDALVAEIENLLKPIKQRLERDKNDPCDSDIAVHKFGIQLIKNINTLEVKEIDVDVNSSESDLDSETVQVIDANGNISEITFNKAQKGENI